jgi:Domain of unknown function (DUF5668)/B-box zinc finger
MNCAVHTDKPAAAYCRTCGKALCENCKRDVMGAIYCEPCIAVRLQGAAQAQGQVVLPAAATVPGTPSPGVAMLLGFIPGVGAMYNGQFMKGFIHVVLFVMLIVATQHYGMFGILIAFFIFYMAFDAYKTAEAKRLGLPLPDPLGLDRLFGLQEGHHAPAVPATGSAPGAAQTSTVGSATFVEQPQTPEPAVSRDNAPVGAIILIALGVIFLLGNVVSFSLHRFWPLILIGVGLWLAYRRLAMGPRESR